MSNIIVKPIIEQIEAKVVALVTPPFRIYEPFQLIGEIGEALYAAAPLQTEEEYKAAITECLAHFDQRYGIASMADDALKWRGFLAPLEAFDGMAINHLLYNLAVPQLAHQLSLRIG